MEENASFNFTTAFVLAGNKNEITMQLPLDIMFQLKSTYNNALMKNVETSL
jgi:hypothetical protein